MATPARPAGTVKPGRPRRHNWRPEWEDGNQHTVTRGVDFDGVSTKMFRQQFRNHYNSLGLSPYTWAREGDPNSFFALVEGGELDGS
jgi:hypothetical protein